MCPGRLCPVGEPAGIERPAVHAREHEALPAATLLEAVGEQVNAKRFGNRNPALASPAFRLDQPGARIPRTLHMNESLLKIEVQPIKRLQLAATKPGIQRGSPHRPIAERKRRYQGRRLTRSWHAFSTRPKRRQRKPQRRVHADLAAIKRPPVDRPQRKHSVPDSARRTPLPNHPISEILNLVPSNARKTHIGERGKHPPTQIPLITAKRRRLVRRPRTRTNKTRLRRRHPLLRSLANRQRTRSAHRLPANSRLTLLTPNTRLRQRPKRPPNRLPVPPRPNLRLIRRRTRTPTPHPRDTTPLMPNLDPLMRPPPPHSPSARQLLHHDQHT